MVRLGEKGTATGGRKKRRQTQPGRGHLGSTAWAGLYAEHYPPIRSWFAATVAACQRLQRIIRRLRERYAGEPPAPGDGKDPKILNVISCFYNGLCATRKSPPCKPVFFLSNFAFSEGLYI
jgi:hypothetical protein